MPFESSFSRSGSPDSNDNLRNPLWGVVAVAVVGGLILISYVLWQIQHIIHYTPAAELELKTQDVPLSKQVFVLVDDSSPSPYFDSVRVALVARLVDLTETEQMCFFQVRSDNPLMPMQPWCTEQIKRTWWVLPEIKPAPYDSPEEEQEYAAAKTKLEQELEGNVQRAEKSWEAAWSLQADQLNSLLWQFPPQPYKDIRASLVTLLTAHVSGVPVELDIYSEMHDSLQTQGSETTSPALPQLHGAAITIHLMTGGGDQRLADAQGEWNPWFQSNQPNTLDWVILESVTGQSSKPATFRPVVASHHLLPPVVDKPDFQDATSVVKGMDTPGDVTNVAH